MSIHVGVSGVVRDLSAIHVGYGGVVREIAAGYCGQGGTIKKCFPAGTSPPDGMLLVNFSCEEGLETVSIATEREIFTMSFENNAYSTPISIGEQILLGLGGRTIVNLSGSGWKLIGGNDVHKKIEITSTNPMLNIHALIDWT